MEKRKKRRGSAFLGNLGESEIWRADGVENGRNVQDCRSARNGSGSGGVEIRVEKHGSERICGTRRGVWFFDVWVRCLYPNPLPRL